MATLSFLDKLVVLWEVSKSSKLFIIALIFILFLGIILITTNKVNLKSSRRMFILLYLFIIVVSIMLYKESLSNMFDYLMNNLFVVIYFPNLAVYLAAIFLTTIILWVSVFNFKTTKLIKNINIIMYCIINYLLFLLLNIINDQKLDVFDQASVYGNKSAQAIIELSSTIFIIWMIFLCLYKAIRIYQTKDETVKEAKKIIKNSRRKLPSNIIEVEIPKMVKAQKNTVKEKVQEELEEISNKELKEITIDKIEINSNDALEDEIEEIENEELEDKIEEIENDVLKDDIEEITNARLEDTSTKNTEEKQITGFYEKPKIKFNEHQNTELTELDKLLTVDDYKLLLSILKAKREEKEQERLRKEKEEKQLAKFNELQEFYRVR